MLRKSLILDIFKYWIKALSENRPTKRRIYIPKFQLEQTFLGLTEILKRMGVEDLFIPGKADLSGINGKKNLYCSAVVHKAFIKVDEEGTIAAAATGIGIKATSFTPSFVIDRPFFVLHHRQKIQRNNVFRKSDESQSFEFNNFIGRYQTSVQFRIYSVYFVDNIGISNINISVITLTIYRLSQGPGCLEE